MKLSLPPGIAFLARKSRVLVILGVMLFVGFLLTNTVSYLISRKSIRQAILEEELPLSSNNIYSEIQRDLFEPILISSLMATDTFVKDWIKRGEQDPTQIIRFLKQIQEKYHTVTSFLVSEQTRNYYHSDSILKQVREDNPADEWFFRVREMKQPYEINVDPDMANKDAMTIFINFRIVDDKDHFYGATGVGLTVNAVKRLMQDYRERYKRDVYFYDRKGDLVLHSMGEDAKEKNLLSDHNVSGALHSILQRISKGEKDVNFSAVADNGAMVNYRYIPELEWILVVEQTSDGTTPILYQSFTLNFLISLAMAIVLLGLIRKTVLRYQRNLEEQNRQLQHKNDRIEEQSEELVEANRKLDALHQEKDEYIGIIVHDLKTPLNAVQGFSELLLQEPVLDQTAREYAEHIASSSTAMLSQVEDLLKLTELESVSEISITNLDPCKVISEVVSHYETHAQAKDIKVVTKFPKHAVQVLASADWLALAIDNLLSNAIKYSPTGHQVALSVIQHQAEVEISVQDEGEGLTPQEIGRLFRKFERLSPRPTGGESSSGLGLYLVRQMVHRMGGRVWCDSVKGQGSIFRIALPIP